MCKRLLWIGTNSKPKAMPRAVAIGASSGRRHGKNVIRRPNRGFLKSSGWRAGQMPMPLVPHTVPWLRDYIPTTAASNGVQGTSGAYEMAMDRVAG